MFEANNNILQLVVGKLFRKFKSDVEEENPKDDARLRAKRELIICFEKIYQNIRILFNQANTDSESLDALLDLAASYDLKENFRKLIDLYLEWNDKKDGALILQIDDIDLQTRYAYDMVEQIRKYMMHPNIIILMAVRLSQLEEVITRQYVEEFQSLLGSNGYMAKEAPEEMSERYLGKLIPHDRRLFLLEMEDLFTAALTIKDPDIEKSIEFPSVRHAVLELIFQKTRFLFYDTKRSTNYIIPRNLRELRSLIRLLYKMSDFSIHTSDGNIQKYPYNKVLFQKYFFRTWLHNNLDKSSITLIQTVWNAELSTKNSLVLSYLYETYLKNDNTGIPPHINQILLSSQKAYDNISLGDVLGLLDFMDTYLDSPKDWKLIFAIRTIYSMLLYRYHDEYKEKTNIKKDSGKEAEETILLKEMQEQVPAYLKLIGGQVINSRLYDLLPAERQSGRPRTQKNINTRSLLIAVHDILRDPDANKINDPDSIAVLNLMEFIILNIIARTETDSQNKHTLLSGKPSYLFTVTPNTYHFRFDIFGFLCSLPQIEKVYQRFAQWFSRSKDNERLKWQNFVSQNPNSLYLKITHAASQHQQYESAVALRNTEIIHAFVSHTLQNRLEGAKDNLDIYAKFYTRLSRFHIPLYDNHKLHFGFIKEFGKIFFQITPKTTPLAFTLFNNVLFPQETLNTNIRLNSKSKNTYETLLRKLKQKNNDIYIDSLFRQVFFEKRSYTTSEVIRLLDEMKRRYEDLTEEDNG